MRRQNKMLKPKSLRWIKQRTASSPESTQMRVRTMTAVPRGFWRKPGELQTRYQAITLLKMASVDFQMELLIEQSKKQGNRTSIASDTELQHWRQWAATTRDAWPPTMSMLWITFGLAAAAYIMKTMSGHHPSLPQPSKITFMQKNSELMKIYQLHRKAMKRWEASIRGNNANYASNEQPPFAGSLTQVTSSRIKKGINFVLKTTI